MSTIRLGHRVYTALAEDEDARVCRDIPEAACHAQPRAFHLQLMSQSLTKLGDALTSSRLVLAWMLSALGVPVAFIALLVPVRESLSLLPQLVVAQAVREHAIRKGFWVWGSVGQGLCLLGMVPAILFLRDAVLGACILGLLALFSLSRGVCSVAAKDVLGKTVSKSRRGRLSGLAASISGAITLLVGTGIAVTPLLLPGAEALAGPLFFAGLLLVSALLWFAAANIYAAVPEEPGATQGGVNAFIEALRSIGLLRSDRDFRQFVIARMLLVATAFVIPYVVVMIQTNAAGQGFSFAALLLAEGAAGLLSGPLWGRWSDRRSERVMAAAAALSVAMVVVVLVINGVNASWLGFAPVAGGLLFVAAVAHQGARIGRKTYLIDMASGDNRAQYTAVSNTVIGLFLFSGAALGWVDTVFGTPSVLVLLALVAALGVLRCASLSPVE